MNRPSLPGKRKFHNLGGKLRISCCPDGVSSCGGGTPASRNADDGSEADVASLILTASPSSNGVFGGG